MSGSLLGEQHMAAPHRPPHSQHHLLQQTRLLLGARVFARRRDVHALQVLRGCWGGGDGCRCRGRRDRGGQGSRLGSGRLLGWRDQAGCNTWLGLGGCSLGGQLPKHGLAGHSRRLHSCWPRWCSGPIGPARRCLSRGHWRAPPAGGGAKSGEVVLVTLAPPLRGQSNMVVA